MTARATPRRLATGCLAALTVALVTGCGPSQEELMDQSETLRTTAQDAAERGVTLARELNPDILLDLDPSVRGERWSDCSSLPAPDSNNPTDIVWLADRYLLAEPAQNTGPMIDPIVAGYVADGWTATVETSGDGGRAVEVVKDGYTVAVRGVTDVPESGRAPYLIISVSSPCIEAPEGIADREP